MSHLSTITATPAANSPITTAELIAHLRLPTVQDGAAITQLAALLNAAREFVEGQTGRGMAPATYRELFTAAEVQADAMLHFARGPVTAISAIKYWPADGSARVTVTSVPAIAALLVEMGDMLPGAAFITSALTELALYDRPDALTVDYVAGHAPGACPDGMKHAVLLLAALWHEERLPLNVGNIINELPYGLGTLIQHQRVGGWVA
jgi:uncharacterized phiE125 gp8 family phage protein